jgi:hypothetical protein
VVLQRESARAPSGVPDGRSGASVCRHLTWPLGHHRDPERAASSGVVMPASDGGGGVPLPPAGLMPAFEGGARFRGVWGSAGMVVGVGGQLGTDLVFR